MEKKKRQKAGVSSVLLVAGCLSARRERLASDWLIDIYVRLETKGRVKNSRGRRRASRGSAKGC